MDRGSNSGSVMESLLVEEKTNGEHCIGPIVILVLGYSSPAESGLMDDQDLSVAGVGIVRAFIGGRIADLIDNVAGPNILHHGVACNRFHKDNSTVDAMLWLITIILYWDHHHLARAGSNWNCSMPITASRTSLKPFSTTQKLEFWICFRGDMLILSQYPFNINPQVFHHLPYLLLMNPTDSVWMWVDGAATIFRDKRVHLQSSW
ncbi:hypothetical protein CK203_006972 [Vitis vinifera]|uniref:Uncharacterized protein n=1 Tax=Vitis vinifera TaxID=29760 RepID=A0A438KCI3_VITVI|nr:hypothetical protein CK203_006972 [Vitis vinifera]